jgi:acyl-homoserine lactone acylase PvdQ
MAGASTVPPPTYRANDYAQGRAMNILPPGENGLVNATDLIKFETTGVRPPNSEDQLFPYRNLEFGYKQLTDSTLSTYYGDESFGIPNGQIARTEVPSSSVPVKIYRDRRDVPHIYGATDAALAYGAGYAQAEDRLFLMDVLRHYGEGTLSAFIGPSCGDEQMDHDQLLLAPYTTRQANAQVDALGRFGPRGKLAASMIKSFAAGVNGYIAQANSNPALLPADYVAALQGPQPWAPADVVGVAGLIGGIFGDGGGHEIANAALLHYLDRVLGKSSTPKAFADFKEQNDPAAPTTVVDRRFPYEIPGRINPKATAMPDHPTAPLVGGPTDTTPNCTLAASSRTALGDIASLLQMPAHMSNALVVGSKYSANGHPLAVFGPQVSYFAPQILMLEDLHGPNYDAEGASFPGTGIVELGRGRDFAWSATSAGSDLSDQRLELVCNPAGGKPAPTGTYYEFKGKCLPMTAETFTETAVPKPGGTGKPVTINHRIYLTRHGIVQGWTTAGGRPVAVVNQRSTYGHEVDSIIGFLHWGDPALTHDAASWMVGASQINYTFNWFYVDDRDIAYYVSGLDPVRPAYVDPNLPTWGTGIAEWQGFLPAVQHVHEINPPAGFFVSWNNKPAPGFSASDTEYGYGPVYRSQLLTAQIEAKIDQTHGKLTRAELVQAMETAATQDLDGVTVLPELLREVSSRHEPPGVQAMIRALTAWYASGAHRIGASPSAAQYQQADAVAIMDQLVPTLIRHIFDPLLRPGGVVGAGEGTGYTVVPMGFVNEPYNGGAHLGSAYDGGWEGYLVKVLRELQGQAVPEPFGPALVTRLCASGLKSCGSAIDAALAATYKALVKDNGGSGKVAGWTSDDETVAAGLTMPKYDAIGFRAVGIIGQPDIPWQNRPTFQQVISFPAHRPRAA